MRNKKLISFLLAFLILFTAMPLNVLAAPELVNITFTDGTKSVTEEFKKGAKFTIPSELKRDGKLITSLTDSAGNTINPMEPVYENKTLTVGYGDKIEATFSLVGNKARNDKDDQLIKPTKYTLTVEEINKQREKYNITDKGYANIINLAIKAYEDNNLLDARLEGEISEGYIKEVEALKAGEPTYFAGFMFFINNNDLDVGTKEAPLLNNDVVRQYYQEKSIVYTFFDSNEKTIKAREPFEVTLKTSSWNWQTDETTYGVYEGATILIDGKPYEKDGNIVKTDSNGKATIVVNDPKAEYLSADDKDASTGYRNIVMPYMALTVEEEANIPEDWIEAKAKEIADSYKEPLKDLWKIMEMAKYHELNDSYGTESPFNEETKEYIKSQVFGSDGKPKTGLGDAAKNILAVRAAGMDPENYYGYNLVEVLTKQETQNPAPYVNGPVLNALSSDKYDNTPDIEKARDYHISKLLEIQGEDNLWNASWGTDNAGFALYALAPYKDRAEVKAAIDKAVEALKAKQLDNGDFVADTGNSNSLSMVAGGISGVSTELVKDISKNGNTMYDALKEYDVTGGLEWQKNKGSNAMATEQGFRALVSYLATKEGKGDIFNYSNLPKVVVGEPKKEVKVDEDWIEAKAKGIADEYAKKASFTDPMQVVSYAKYLQTIDEFSKDKINEATLTNLKNKNNDFNNLPAKILGLRAAGIDPENYNNENLIEKLKGLSIPNSASLEKLSLGLGALNSDNYTTDVKTKIDEYINKIIAKQGANGLWSNDADTGHALYALSAFYNDNTRPNVKESVDKALEAISSKLNKNARLNDSTSQSNTIVVGGMSNIDHKLFTDEKFVKNDKNMIDGLKAFEADYGFMTADYFGDRNDASTEHGFRALVSYLANKNSKGHIFDFRDTDKRTLPETKTFTVTFNSNEGTNVVAQKVVENEKATEPTPAPTKDGFIFEGWYTDSELNNKFNFDTLITSDITLYAKWIEETKAIDKSELETAIKKANELTKADTTSADGNDVEPSKTWVTEKIKTALETALNTAKTVKDNADATQEEVNKAVEELDKAVKAYKPEAGKKVPVEVPEEWIISKANSLYKPYITSKSSEDLNYILPIAKYELINNKEKTINKQTLQTVKNNLIKNNNFIDNVPLKTLANNIIILRSAQVDPEHYYGVNLIEKLTNKLDSTQNVSISDLTLGLNALNTDKYENVDYKKYVNSLISKQDSAGLWKEAGMFGQEEKSDPIEALAPFYNNPEYKNVNDSINKALGRLSEKQDKTTGDFKDSWGDSDAYTLFPIIRHITNTDLELLKDSRIVKNNKTLYDVMKTYDVNDGFQVSPDFNWKDAEVTDIGNATVVSYLSMKENYGTIYDFSKAPKNPLGEYKVEFKPDNGSEIPTQYVGEGKKATEPTGLTKEGYMLEGWYTDETLQNKFDFNQTINSDKVLYAKWTEISKEYKVTFDSKGGTAVTEQTVKENETATEPTAPTRDGFTFEGWYTDEALTEKFEFTTPITKDTTLYAKWTEISREYKVTFESNGGTAVTEQTVKENETATEPTAPTRDGFTFEGWYTDEALTEKFEFTTPITKDTTLYAKWTKVPKEYKVTFDSKGGSAVTEQTVKENETATEPTAPTKDGFTFEGWYTDEALTEKFEFTTPITKDTTLYAKWTEVPKEYKVTFDSKGGTAVTEQTVKENETATEPTAPTRDGFTFEGWYTDEALTEKFEFTTPITKDTTLYAKWTAVPVVIDKTDLEKAIKAADELPKADAISTDGTDVEKDKTWVTEDATNALNNALTEAKKVIANDNATQEEVDNATTALNTAIENYNPQSGTKEEIVPPVVIDKTELEKAITSAENKSKDVSVSTDGKDVEKDKTWVTEEAKKALDDAIKAAEEIKNKADATQEEVDNATEALTKAIENYKPVVGTKEEIVPPVDVDTTKLESEIKYLEKLLNSYYVSNDGRDVPKDRLWITPLMKENLLKSLNEAKDTLNNNSLTSEELEKAISELTEAIKEFNKPEVGKAETRPVDPRPVEPRPVDPIYSRPSRPERDRYDYGHTDYAPFLPGLGFVTPGRVYTTPSVDTRPIETKPTETKPTNEIKPVVPVFTDIIGHWAEPAINSVVAKDYFKGTGVDTFSPNRAITRAEIVTVLGRIAGVNPANYTNTTMTDVEHGSYYEGYVNWAVEKGLVNGVGENKFDPNSEASREEVATIISRYLDMIGKNTTATSELSYKDSQEISQWAKDAVNKLTELGVFKGQDGNRFNATSPITRAEIAQVIYNMDNANLIK